MLRKGVWMRRFFFKIKNDILQPYLAVLFGQSTEKVEAEDALTRSKEKSMETFRDSFYSKWGFIHNLYQITNKDIRQIDIWLKKPVTEFLNMVVYLVEFSKLEEMEMKNR